jgi:phosphoglycerol transferase
MSIQRWAARFAVYLLALIGFGTTRWVYANFDHPSIDQIVYHLRFNEGLAAAGGGAFLVTFVVESVAAPLLLAFLLVRAEAALLPHLRPLKSGGRAGRLMGWVGRAAPALVFVVSASLLSAQLSAPAYARSLFGRDFFSAHYVAPSTVELRHGALKNLVLIYVESLESAYGDPALFGRRDLLQGLRDIEGTSFADYRPAPGTGWTMGGIVATQCGIPLKTMSVFESSETAEPSFAFLPGAVCLGDVLAAAGYRNVYLGGARLSFAGKGMFLADHGYHERYGQREWPKLGESGADMSEWGLYDDRLFQRAKQKLKALHATGQRFNLTLLTLDTHHTHGFYSPRCKREGATDFAGIVECTARMVGELVRFAKDNGMLEDTRIVIVGDHLAMPNPVYSELQRAPQRTIYNAFVPAGVATKATEQLLPYDMYPTILQFIGFDVVGGRLGLGYAGFEGAGSARRSAAELDALIAGVGNPSERYAELWRPRPRAEP